MHRILIQFKDNNDSFIENPLEWADVLTRASEKALRAEHYTQINTPLRDTNGNTIGVMAYTDDPIDPIEGVSIEVNMGNEAMQTPEDLALLLVRTAKQLENGPVELVLRDENGNTVGFVQHDASEQVDQPYMRPSA